MAVSPVWAYLGPLGAMQTFDVTPGVQVAPARPSSTLVTMGGRQYTQYAPRAPRSWACNVNAATPTQLAYATALAQGAVAGDLYLLTSDALSTNMLPPHLASPGMGGDTTLGAVSASAVLVDTTPMTGAAGATAAGAWSPIIPVRASVKLALACWIATTVTLSTGTPVLNWRTVDASGATLASGNAGRQSGVLRAAGLFTPGSTAVGLQIRIAASLASVFVGGIRLLETPTDPGGTWLPGRGVGTVVLDDPQETLNFLLTSGPVSDYTFTIHEEG